jgi:phytoene dehydrogenase-like protein
MKNSATEIAIVGAGIAGLAAGCYAQMNGYRSQIFEMHHQPGGLCTAWQRQGFVFDGCIHYLFGSGQGQPFYRLWEELGVVPQQQFFHHDELLRVSEPNGKTLIVYSNPDSRSERLRQRLEQHLNELSPLDRQLISDFCARIRAFTKFDLSLLQQQPKASMRVGDWVRLTRKMLPFLCPLSRWGNLSAAEFARRFRDPFLRRAIPPMFAWDSIPVMVGMSLLAYMHTKNAGFPLGGSLQFAEKIAVGAKPTVGNRYLELGGEIRYESQVEKILVGNKKAIGIRLYNNEEYRADRVISACDGHNTLFNLLDRQYIPRQIQRYYDGRLPVHSQLQISLGVNRDLSSEPHWTTHLLEEPVVIAGEKRSEIGVKHYCFDSSLAPFGKSVLIVMLTTNYDYWQRIYGRSIYETEELQESRILIDILERFYPGIKADVEFVDVATPLAYERYTGNWQGSSCGWLLTKQTLPLSIKGVPKTLPQLRKFYAIGQWVEPGGSVPVVAMSGRNIIQQICREDRRIFGTTTN